MELPADHQVTMEMPRRRLEYIYPDYPHNQQQQQQQQQLMQQQQGGDCSISEPSRTGTAADADSEVGINGRMGGDGGGGGVVVPKERWKTLLALVCTGSGMLLTAISLSYVHDYVPEYPPLPDISLRLVPRNGWAITACEVLLMLNLAAALAVCLSHRFRWVVLRRVFFILAIVFLYRSVTIAVTAMPDPNSRRNCGPRSNSSLGFVEIVGRVSRVVVGAGFTATNAHKLCGDSIFSGHTASLTLAYLTIKEYSPASANPLRWASLITCLISFSLLVLSHAHYTVDLLIGYWLANRLFLMVHALANCPTADRRDSHLARVWWFPVFEFFEANVPSRLPCEFQLPWWHGCCQRAYQRLGSFRERLRGFIR